MQFFGKVVEGMDVVRLIGVVPTDFRDRPREAVTMEKGRGCKINGGVCIYAALARTAAYIQAGLMIWSTVWQCITADAAPNIRADAVLWSWSTAKKLPDKEAALRRECAMKKAAPEQKLALLQTWQARIAE